MIHKISITRFLITSAAILAFIFTHEAVAMKRLIEDDVDVAKQEQEDRDFAMALYLQEAEGFIGQNFLAVNEKKDQEPEKRDDSNDSDDSDDSEDEEDQEVFAEIKAQQQPNGFAFAPQGPHPMGAYDNNPQQMNKNPMPLPFFNHDNNKNNNNNNNIIINNNNDQQRNLNFQPNNNNGPQMYKNPEPPHINNGQQRNLNLQPLQPFNNNKNIIIEQPMNMLQQVNNQNPLGGGLVLNNFQLAQAMPQALMVNQNLQNNNNQQKIYVDNLQNASAEWVNGALKIGFTNLDNMGNQEYISLDFNIAKFLPEEDYKLIEKLCALIEANQKSTKRIRHFRENFAIELLNENKKELSKRARVLISNAIEAYESNSPKIDVEFRKLTTYLNRELKRRVRPTITLDSPILKGIGGKEPPLFIARTAEELSQHEKVRDYKEEQRKNNRLQQQHQQQQLLQHPFNQQLQLLQQQQQMLRQQQPMINHNAQNQNAAQKGWTYNRADARNASPEEASLYIEIRKKALELLVALGPHALNRVMVNIGDAETLHVNNIEVCDELFNNKWIFSKKFPGVVLHGEQNDANLELRANFIFLVLQSAWEALKIADDQNIYIDFFKNAFVTDDRMACLEGRFKVVDSWYQKNKHLLKKVELSADEKIKHKTIQDNVTELAKIIFDKFMANCKDGFQLKLHTQKSAKLQTKRDKLISELEEAQNNPEHHMKISAELEYTKMMLKIFLDEETKLSNRFATKEIYAKMLEEIKAALLDKEAQDGPITLEQILDILENQLCWEF